MPAGSTIVLALAAALGAALAGCAPSFASLVRGRHFDEARAAVAAQPDPDAAAEELRAGIVAELDPTLHVHAITDADLARLAPAAAATAASRRAVVFARVRVEAAPLRAFSDSIEVRVAWRAAGGEQPAPPLASIADIAAATGERLPAPRVIEPSFAERAWYGAAAAAGAVAVAGDVAEAFADALTLGGWCAIAHCQARRSPAPTPPEPRVIPPTDAENAAAAPLAAALAAGSARWRCALAERGRCDLLVALPRPTADEASSPLALVVELATTREARPLARYVVALPAGEPALEARVRARFGERLQRAAPFAVPPRQ